MFFHRGTAIQRFPKTCFDLISNSIASCLVSYESLAAIIFLSCKYFAVGIRGYRVHVQSHRIFDDKLSVQFRQQWRILLSA
ncbi:MAG: hypothetical protein C5B59_01740 [Bacteroidetes bacterium]|nr:MAG: hypothetical protein C5B59_01740 [Bacteroidota bacterium]